MEEQERVGKAIFYPNAIRFCEVFNCKNPVKWTIVNGDSTHISYMGYKICNECAKKLIATAPIELFDGERDIRAELEAEFGMKIEEIKAEHKTEIEQLYKKWSAEQPEAPQVLAAKPVIEEKAIEPPPAAPLNEGIFRCLDCDKEFDNKRALSNHMRIHDGVKA